MSITVREHHRLYKFTILGRLEQSGEQQELLAQLTTLPVGEAETSVELDFYDADTLPREVIEALARLLARGTRVKIVAYHALLSHSLIRLGLPVSQASRQPLRVPLGQCKVLALAGSAQSLDKIMHIVGHLPEGDVTVFVAQHVQEDQVNLLDKLLKLCTNYRVLMPHHLIPIKPGTVYVAPPGHHMKVAHGLIYLTRDRKIQFARPSIDVLFESVAREYGAQSLVALLCGYGQDGVAGCAALEAAGACVLIENGDECAPARVLPDNAGNASAFKQVLKYPAITSIAAAAVAGANAAPIGNLLELFLDAIKSQYGHDFRGYQRGSLERRIRNLSSDFNLGNFADFQLAVLTEPALFQRLLAEISVSVTGFFRHPEQFRLLREKIMPYLTSFPLIKIWSAGCATGEEVYSLAIMLDELGILEKSRIFATDINPYLLELAKAGLFPVENLALNREHYLAGGGLRHFDAQVPVVGHFLKADNRLRERILFYQHSLAHDGIFNEFQLILCRNVLIYFDTDLQKRVLGLFAKSLHHDGFLVLGPKDGLQHLVLSQGFTMYGQNSHIYRQMSEQAVNVHQ
ncbi:chemotaxis protein methyltransferase CheR [Gammaproteobacteria bacterium]